MSGFGNQRFPVHHYSLGFYPIQYGSTTFHHIRLGSIILHHVLVHSRSLYNVLQVSRRFYKVPGSSSHIQDIPLCTMTSYSVLDDSGKFYHVLAHIFHHTPDVSTKFYVSIL